MKRTDNEKFPNNKKKLFKRSRFSRVYAGPCASDDSFKCVYAGPELMQNGGAAMNDVYAGPEMPQNVRPEAERDDRTIMMAVYACPALPSTLKRAAQNESGKFAGAGRCPSCGEALRDSVKYCPNCGERVALPRFCSVCGRKLDENADRCPDCGEALL